MTVKQKLQELNIENGSRHIVLVSASDGIVILSTIWQNEIPDLYLYRYRAVCAYEKDYSVIIQVEADYI